MAPNCGLVCSAGQDLADAAGNLEVLAGGNDESSDAGAWNPDLMVGLNGRVDCGVDCFVELDAEEAQALGRHAGGPEPTARRHPQ